MVRGCTASAGCVPAEVAGIGLRRFHNAAASWERAELCVQTNTTRKGVSGPGPVEPVSMSGRSRT